MSSLDTTELKLKTTPTGGVDAAHSPYYRRLLSAGYKGFLQGSIGGGALYGTFGLVIGGLLAVAAGPVLGFGLAAATLIPAATGIGILKGASTFGNIGSVAAINAESSDLSEQRRYLLDRYYDLPEGPEGDREAEAIKNELLKRQGDNETPPPVFHWKTVAIGALVGAALAFTAITLAPQIAIGSALIGLGGHATAAASLLSSLLGAAGGALAGATIGIDRYYVRKWFDHSEGVVHSSSHQETALAARHLQVERIKEAAKEDEQTRIHLRDQAPSTAPRINVEPSASAPTKPGNTISGARLEGLLQIHKAMGLSAL